MERLLADATKLSGVEYNLDNLGDVYSAIHVIQENLGLTGVAAEEASETFTGSLGAMKAAGQNLLANLALGEDITPALGTLEKTVQTFLFKNLFPMLGNILEAVPELVSGLGSMIIGSLNQISANSDQIVQTGIEIVTSLVSAIVSAAPYIVEAAWNLISSLGSALINTDWGQIASDLMTSLRDSIDLAGGEILGLDNTTIENILNGITSGLPELLNTGIEIISSLANSILTNAPQLITTAGTLITEFASFLYSNLPTILQAGATLLLNLVNGIISNLPQIASAAIQAAVSFLATIGQMLPQILYQGTVILMKLIAGLLQAIPQLVSAVVDIIKTADSIFAEYDWVGIGKDILLGIKNGILDTVGAVIDAAKEAAQGIWNAVKSFFEIGSPSRLMYYGGAMLDQGMANGIADNKRLVDDAMDSLNESAVAQLQTDMTVRPGSLASSSNDSRIDNLYSLVERYLPQIAEKDMSVALEGDAQGLFNVMRSQNKVFKKMNGMSAFA